MEDKNETPGAPQPAVPQPGGVMDVQPPKAEPSLPSAPPVQQPHSQPASPVTPAPMPDTLPQAQTRPEGSIAPPEHPAADSRPAIEDHADHLLAAHAASQHHKKPVVAIIVAIIIALALIGLTVLAYLQTKQDTHPQADHEPTPTNQPATQNTETTVDDTSAEVNQALTTVDDTKDLPESDLSDQALGL